MSNGPRALAILHGIGLVASALVLASGIILYPLIEVAVFAPLPLLFVVAAGIWLGAIWPARLALGVGNAAVVAGFVGLLLLYGLAHSGEINPVFFFGTALLFAFGYTLVATSLARGLLARRTRSA
jgi:hypothetical protein